MKHVHKCGGCDVLVECEDDCVEDEQETIVYCSQCEKDLGL